MSGVYILKPGVNVVVEDLWKEDEFSRRTPPTESELREAMGDIVQSINQQGGTLISALIMPVLEDLDRRHPSIQGPLKVEDRLVLFIQKKFLYFKEEMPMDIHQEVLELIPLFVANELKQDLMSFEVQEAVQLHLDTCSDCEAIYDREFLRQGLLLSPDELRKIGIGSATQLQMLKSFGVSESES